jgi:hypothetical protein
MSDVSKAAGAGVIEALNFRLPIMKVDKEKREIVGVATAEILDVQGEIVDYATAKSAFEKWRGNIREMHQPKAVGKKVSVDFDDANKQIIVTSYISKGAADTWEKICDGTLSDYSIGAMGVRKAEKNGDQAVSRVYLTRMGELSVVDAGALPGSTFEIVKMDGEQPIEAQPEEPEAEAAAPAAEAPKPAEKRKIAIIGGAELRKSALTLEGRKSLLADLRAVLKDEAELDASGLAEPIRKRYEGYDIRTALTAIACLEDLIGSEMFEVEYAGVSDPEAPAQLEMLRNAAELVLSFLISEFMSQFEDSSATDAAAEVAMSATRALEIIKAAPIGFQALNSEGRILFFTKAGARHSKADSEMIQKMHDTSISLGAHCSSENKTETNTENEADGDNEGESEKKKAASPAAAPVEKNGPATPPAETNAGDSATPAAAAAAAQEQPTAAQPAHITKLEGLLEKATQALTEAQTTISAQAGTIAKLEERVVKLEDQPMPGGPITRPTGAPMTRVTGTPVAKSIGNSSAAAPASGAAGSVSAEATIAALQMLGENAKNDEEREMIAQKILAVQFATGSGGRRVAISAEGKASE